MNTRKRTYRGRGVERMPKVTPGAAGTDYGQRKCIFCGLASGDTREHIAPNCRLADRHNWAKEAPCCSRCNHAKGDRLPTEAEFEAFERFWELEVQRLRIAVAEMRLQDAQCQTKKGGDMAGARYDIPPLRFDPPRKPWRAYLPKSNPPGARRGGPVPVIAGLVRAAPGGGR